MSRFDFPEDIVRVTAGEGSECLLVFTEEKTILMEAGMAFAGKALVQNIKKALDERERMRLDYVTLSHSHYDHIGGLPYVLDEWPDACVIASQKAKKVFGSTGAGETMARLTDEAAETFGGEPGTFRFSDLRVDVVAGDNDLICLGSGEYLRVLETKGHTDCCLTFCFEPEKIMFSSESTGVIRQEGVITSAILKSYEEAVASAKKCLTYRPEILITPHYGVMTKEENVSFFIWFLIAAKRERDYIVESYDSTGSMEETLKLYEKRYWDEDFLKGQPKAAFNENAKYTVRNILKEAGRI